MLTYFIWIGECIIVIDTSEKFKFRVQKSTIINQPHGFMVTVLVFVMERNCKS